MRFSLGELDVADKVGIGNCFVCRDDMSGDKEDGVGPVNAFGWETRFTATLR